MISSVDLAHYGVSRVKDWVSRDCGTRNLYADQMFRTTAEAEGEAWIQQN